MHTLSSLTKDFETLGIAPGDTVMLHASVRAVGILIGGPDVILGALSAALGSAGTLMMYLGCPEGYDDIGRRVLPLELEAAYSEHLPAFDPQQTRACREFGILAEFFRSTAGVRCSANPGARIGALGAEALQLTANHPLDYGYGPGSPLEKLCMLEGKLLLLGSDPDQITLLHYAEHLAPLPVKRIVRYRAPLLIEGRRVLRATEEFDTSAGVLDWPEPYFATIFADYLAAGGSVSQGNIGDAEAFLVPARELVDFAVAHMVRTATALEASLQDD